MIRQHQAGVGLVRIEQVVIVASVKLIEPQARSPTITHQFTIAAAHCQRLSFYFATTEMGSLGEPLMIPGKVLGLIGVSGGEVLQQ